MYCKNCKHNVEEKFLYKEKLCPTCGKDIYVEPFTFKFKREKRPTHTVLCVFIDRESGLEQTIIYDGVTDHDYHRLVHESLNVVKVVKLIKEENHENRA